MWIPLGLTKIISPNRCHVNIDTCWDLALIRLIMLYYMSNIMVKKVKVLGQGYVIEFKNIHINLASNFFPRWLWMWLGRRVVIIFKFKMWWIIRMYVFPWFCSYTNLISICTNFQIFLFGCKLISPWSHHNKLILVLS